MPPRASRIMSRDHHSPMVFSERATGHALALKDLCRIAPHSESPENLVAPLYQMRASYQWLHHATRLEEGGSLRLIRLREPKCNVRAEFKLRRGIHTNEKHRQSSGTLRTDDKKRVQQKFDALRRRFPRSTGRPCRRSERSSGCPTPAS